MKMRFYRPSVKQKLVASALFSIFSLLLLWLMLGYPMPTPGLAFRKAESQALLSHSPIVARGTVQYTAPGLSNSPGDRWLVSRRGNEFHLLRSRRVAWLLWDSALFLPMTPTEDRPVFYFPVGFRNTFRQEGNNYYRDGTEVVSVAVTADPAVARVELTQYDLPRQRDETAFRAEHSATTECAETSPGSGVWVGRQVVPYVESKSDGYASCTQVRAYTADGSLFYESPDRLLSME